MPNTVQIVPDYSYPYVKTVLNDNTIRDKSDIDAISNSTVENLNYISVFASSKGVDNKLIRKSALSSFHSTYGYSNYKLFGQPFMMAEALLSNPNTDVWCMRVMPDDATYSHTVVSLWYKADTVNKKFNIKMTSKAMASNETIDLNSIESIRKGGQVLDGQAVDGVYKDTEGYVQVPFMVVNSDGRGKYGNNIRWRIVTNTDYEKKYGIKLYSFEIIDTENGSETIARYVGGVTTSTKTVDATFINDVLEDVSVGLAPVYIHVFEENIESMYNAYVDFCNEMKEADPTASITIPELDVFDPLFGKDIARNKVKVPANQPFMNFVEQLTPEVNTEASDYDATKYATVPAYNDSSEITAEKFIYVDDVSGNCLSAGSDGSFDVSVDAVTRQSAIDACYIKAFSGEYDKLIMAPRRIQAEALFDANYSSDVKKCLVKLALFRKDAICYMDAGIMDTLTESDVSSMDGLFDDTINSMDEQYQAFADKLISMNLQDYKVKESSTGKRVAVTTTYYLALRNPSHILNNGRHVPMVNEYCTLSGHVKNTLKPSIEIYEKDLMDRLYLSRFNYFECIDEDTFVRATQNTFQEEDSDLLEENNVNVLMWLKRHVEDDARDQHYKFTSATTRTDFAQYIKQKYHGLVGREVESLDIQYKVNEFEYNRSIVHAYLAVTFRPLAKQTILEIDVNKRQYDEETENATE